MLNSKIAKLEKQSEAAEAAQANAELEAMKINLAAMSELFNEYMVKCAALELELKVCKLRLLELESKDASAGN